MSGKRRKQPLFELGRYWLAREWGQETVYRYWYDGPSGKVRRRSLGTSDIEEAKLQLAKLVVGRAADNPQSPESVPVIAVLQHYWTTHSDMTPGSVQARRAGELLVEWLVDVQNRPSANAADFTTAWQQAFVRWCALSKGHAVGTISRNLSTLAAAMNHALKIVVVDEDGAEREVQLLKYAVPVIYKAEEVSRLTGKPVSVPRDWLPSFEQMVAFIDGIGRMTKAGEWDHNRENLFRYVVLGLNTWARPLAILELSVSRQIDFSAGLVKLNPPGRKQTKKVRPTIPLTDNLRAWLDHWALEHPVHRHGEPVTTIKKVFKAYATAMGMPQFTPYTLRHFMATNVRKVEGVTVSREQRQEWLGHKRQDTTSWYEHHDAEWLQEARIATDHILSRIDGLLQVRSLQPPTSQRPPKRTTSEGKALKLVVSK